MKNVLKRTKAIALGFMYVAIYYVVSVITQLVYYISQRRGAVLGSDIEANLRDSSFALYVIAAIISIWIYMIIGKFRGKPLYVVIEERNVPQIIYLMSVCMAFGARFLVTVYYHYSQNIEVLKKSIDAAAAVSPKLSTPTQLLAAVLSIVVAAPFFEEVLFRGIVMNEFKSVMRPWAANALQSVVFGMAHAVLYQSIFATVLGFILGVIYQRTHNLRTTIICHSVFNFSVILTQTQMSPATVGIFMSFGLLLVLCPMVYILLTCKNK